MAAIDAWGPTALERLIDEDLVVVVPVHGAEAEPHPTRRLQASTGKSNHHHVVVVLDLEAGAAGHLLELRVPQIHAARPAAGFTSCGEGPLRSARAVDLALDVAT